MYISVPKQKQFTNGLSASEIMQIYLAVFGISKALYLLSALPHSDSKQENGKNEYAVLHFHSHSHSLNSFCVMHSFMYSIRMYSMAEPIRMYLFRPLF